MRLPTPTEQRIRELCNDFDCHGNTLRLENELLEYNHILVRDRIDHIVIAPLSNLSHTTAYIMS